MRARPAEEEGRMRRRIIVDVPFFLSGGTLQSGSVIDINEYDGMNRRTYKLVQNSADLDAPYHYYYTSQWQNIETRNGSSQTVRQHVWGRRYVDELVQIGLNDDPTDSEQDVETFYWATQDANFNVTGIVESDGDLAERYEYTPYGQRTVFTSPGSNDPGCYAHLTMSKRFVVSSVVQPYGMNEVGHQGLLNEGNTDLVYNRSRMLNSSLGRFVQTDNLQYIDGSNLYQYCRSNPIALQDPSGEVCGSGEIGDFLVPDEPFGFDFREACQRHDDCYGTCGSSRRDCDRQFLSDARNRCAQYRGLQREACRATAQIYYIAIRTFGAGPYRNAQDRACCN